MYGILKQKWKKIVLIISRRILDILRSWLYHKENQIYLRANVLSQYSNALVLTSLIKSFIWNHLIGDILQKKLYRVYLMKSRGYKIKITQRFATTACPIIRATFEKENWTLLQKEHSKFWRITLKSWENQNMKVWNSGQDCPLETKV